MADLSPRPSERSTVIPMPTPATGSAVWTTDLRARLDELLDEYRASLHDSLDGLTEDEARLRLVPSKTTLLGLLKHVTYVEGVWFDQAISGGSYTEIGIPSTPDRSFTLKDADTVASLQEAHRSRCEVSRRNMAELTPRCHGSRSRRSLGLGTAASGAP